MQDDCIYCTAKEKVPLKIKHHCTYFKDSLHEKMNFHCNLGNESLSFKRYLYRCEQLF